MTLPAAASGNRFAQRLFTPLPARYDRLAEVLSMGQNGRWRRAMVDQIVPAAGQVVLDVASGTAGVAIQLADRTDARIVGVDLTEQMLRQGKRNVAAAGAAGRVRLVAGRGEQLPFPGGRLADRRPGMVHRRAVPRPQHLRALPQVSGLLDGRGMAASRIRGCWSQGHEPRRRARDVGNPYR